MKVLLLKSHKKLGQAGELKEVSDGYARNYLIPEKIAKIADTKSVQDFKNKKQLQEKKIIKFNTIKQNFIKKLNQQDIEITRPANESGVLFAQVKKEDILEALKSNNLSVVDLKIFDYHFKNIGNHLVKIEFPDKTFHEFTINIKAQK